MTVFARQYGRTGNQLFQQAAAIGYAMKNGMKYSLNNATTLKAVRSGAMVIKEEGHNYNDLLFLPHWARKNIILDGYWQSARYFDHCREEVLKAFVFNWELKKGWCSIHVRRGDYLLYPDKHPVVPYDYLKLAIINIVQRTDCRKFLVFSDDIPWCKEAFQHCKHHIEYSEGRAEREDLELMSCCEHNIISNSTFSWWAAWLGQNTNKVVISPSKDNWFGPGNAHLDTSDLIPDYWIQIKY